MLEVGHDLLINCELECHEGAVSEEEGHRALVKWTHAVALDLFAERMDQVLVLKDVVDRLESALNQIVGILDRQGEYFCREAGEQIAESHIERVTKIVFKDTLQAFVNWKVKKSADSRPVEAGWEPFAKSIQAFLLPYFVHQRESWHLNIIRLSLCSNVHSVNEVESWFDGQVCKTPSHTHS